MRVRVKEIADTSIGSGKDIENGISNIFPILAIIFCLFVLHIWYIFALTDLSVS